MNAEQVARILGISGKTVLRHIAKGTIVATHKNAQELLIAEDQVEILRQALVLEKSRRLPGISQDMSGQMADLTARVAELEEKVRALESGQMSLHVPEKPQAPLHRFVVDRESQPPKRNIAPSPDLPDGAIGLSDFATQHGISLSSASRWVKNGDIPTEQRQRAGRPQHFLTIEQQEQAIEWMRKYGKLS